MGNKFPSLQIGSSPSQAITVTSVSLLLHKVWWRLKALILVRVVMDEVSLRKARGPRNRGHYNGYSWRAITVAAW